VELAIHLNGLGHESTLVEMTEHLASKTELTERTSYMIHLEKTGVKSLTLTTCTEITDKGVRVKNADGEQFIEADTVIIAVGTKPLIAEREKFNDTAFDVISVGDCVKASSIVHAVHTGFDAGLTL
ncbi:MAG: FAD-dependent oxidoreductase, partial [Mailhella sp.]|nr:FAD-dependent oxidoreductase [Mailhella sp.]